MTTETTSRPVKRALISVSDKSGIVDFARQLTEIWKVEFPDGLESIADFPNLTAAMQRAGWSETKIRRVMGENWLSLLDRVW